MERSIRQGTGLVHIYCGDGKGKTTTGMGLCTRAAGYGYQVMIYQFMKNNTTSERKILEGLDNVTWLDGRETVKFSFLMNDEEKAQQRAFYNAEFDRVTALAVEKDVDVLFLDETVYCIGVGFLDEDRVIRFLENKPDKMEVILTGQNPSEDLCAQADYVSEIRKIKHPYDRKQPARKGIEK